MEKVDILIVGAGVVGLAVARELAEKEKSILVLEKNSSFGQETSSRNSEVIHAGMYYPQASLKARTCVEGRHLLYDLCQNNGIPYRKTGKLIVAANKEETGALEELFIQGKNNGLGELALIGKSGLNEMEPHVSGLAALYSPETGIVDSHRLMQFFLDSAKSNGAMAVFDAEVISIEKSAGGYKVSVENNGEISQITAQILINCAGLESDQVAQMAGLDIEDCRYKLKYCKGQYFRVNSQKSRLVKRLIYPVPKPSSGGLGIHATLDLGEGLRLGPDDKYLNHRDKDYSVDNSKRRDFYLSVNNFLPFIEENDLTADISGIRPKLQSEKEGFRDFVIQEESARGYSGLVNLIGIESPGLTASPAIARFVKRLIENGN